MTAEFRWGLRQEVEEFLYREAWLLDEGRLYEWLDLFTEDAMYWMPVREAGSAAEGPAPQAEPSPLFFDDKEFLSLRVRRLDPGLAPTDQTPPRTRHLVTNVWLGDDSSADEVTAHSNFLVRQTGHPHAEHIVVGKREDRLRKVDGQWRIARRKVVLEQTVLPRNLSILF